MAVGKLVKGCIGDIFAYCDTVEHDEIVRLLDRGYSRQTFGLSFPFCKEVVDIDIQASPRFWTDVYLVRGRRVRVTSQWVDKHAARFIAYLVAKGIATEEEAIERTDAPGRGVQAVDGLSSRANSRYRGNAIGNAQNAFIRNILSSLGQESFSEQDWLETKAHFNHRCAYCSQPGELVIEHAVPINRESLGEHRLGNLIPSCRKCNADKGGKDFRVFLGDDHEAIARIEAYMESRNYVPLDDDAQMKMVLNMAYREVAALADRYVALINSLFGGTGQTNDQSLEDDHNIPAA